MKYIKEIDGLRFIAILFVLLSHFATPVGSRVSAGYYGVDLFFVISGFLITGILLNSKEDFLLAYKKFLGRRTLRIFPVYYLTVLVLFLIGNPYVSKYLLYCLTYTYNYAWVNFAISAESPINHFWSLSVEEQFYLFWPFLMLGFRKKQTVLYVVVCTIVLFCGLQLAFNIIPYLSPYNMVGLIPRAYSLGMGALGAIVFREGRIPEKVLRSKWIETVIILLTFLSLVIDHPVKYIVLPLTSVYFVLKGASQTYQWSFFRKLLTSKLAVTVGTYSYGIYLFHFPLDHYITEYVFNPFIWDKIDFTGNRFMELLKWNSWVIKFPLYSLISFLIAWFSYRYFETPFLRLKDTWFKYKS